MTGAGAGGWFKGQAIAVGLAGLVIGASYAPTRKLLQKFLAKPGEGPSEELQRDGFFNLMQIGHLPDGSVLRTRITGDQDPGYGSTRKNVVRVCGVSGERRSGYWRRFLDTGGRDGTSIAGQTTSQRRSVF